MHADIRLGTIVNVSDDAPAYIRQILPHGFESFQLNFPKDLTGIDFQRLAGEVREALGDRAVISSVGFFGNPLQVTTDAANLMRGVEVADLFGCRLVAGFAGAIEGRPLPESLARFKEVWTPLTARAEDLGVKLALENCDMGGWWHDVRWNIAHAPTAWEMIFNEVPSPALGLEWEPCHQMVSLVDPLPQLREWLPKVFHVHGKDATVAWDLVRRYGIRSGQRYVWHRTPGFGDTNWTDVISILRLGGFKGSIDIEGWHDPVYRDDLEMTGQVHGLNYLKRCRGGAFVPNPSKPTPP